MHETNSLVRIRDVDMSVDVRSASISVAAIS